LKVSFNHHLWVIYPRYFMLVPSNSFPFLFFFIFILRNFLLQIKYHNKKIWFKFATVYKFTANSSNREVEV
jgi:hypothetical protein